MLLQGRGHQLHGATHAAAAGGQWTRQQSPASIAPPPPHLHSIRTSRHPPTKHPHRNPQWRLARMAAGRATARRRARRGRCLRLAPPRRPCSAAPTPRAPPAPPTAGHDLLLQLFRCWQLRRLCARAGRLARPRAALLGLRTHCPPPAQPRRTHTRRDGHCATTASCRLTRHPPFLLLPPSSSSSPAGLTPPLPPTSPPAHEARAARPEAAGHVD